MAVWTVYHFFALFSMPPGRAELLSSLPPLNKNIAYFNKISDIFRQNLARGQGFEPRLTGPEPVVLPLDDPRIFK